MAKATGVSWTTLNVDLSDGTTVTDFSITLNGQWNSVGAHLVFRTVPSTSVKRTTTIGMNSVSLANEVLYTDYAITRATGGDLNWSSPGVLADGTVPTWA